MESILETYTARELKKILKHHGFSNYSKLNKYGLIDVMTSSKNKSLFSNIQEKPKKEIEQKKRLIKFQKESNQQFKEAKKITKNNPQILPPKMTEKDIFEKINLHKMRMLQTPSKKQIKILKEKKLMKKPELIITFD